MSGTQTSQGSESDKASPSGNENAASPTQAPSIQSPSIQSHATTQKPVGTAAAEAHTTYGIAAAEPAGVAAAPAKQRRSRSFIIKVGALVGAGVAVGAVVALSAGSSSKPPGAR